MSLLLLLRSGGAAPPPVSTPATIPSPLVEIDFLANPTATYADIQTTQDDGVAFWRMNSTTTFLDERLTFNGTIIGTPTTTASPYPYDSDLALSFDGSADGAYVPSGLGVVSKGNMTVEGWLRIDALPPGANRDVVAKRGAWLLQVAPTGKLVWTLKDDTSTATATTNTPLQVGIWYHVAAVYDSVSMSVYINGVLDVTRAYSAGWEASAQPLRFAQTPSAAAPTWVANATATGSSAVVTGSKPGTPSAGDLMLAYLWFDSYLSGGSNQVPSVATVPSGWTPRASLTDDGNRWKIEMYSRVATASEPASWTWVLSTGVAWRSALSSVTSVNALEPFANPVYVADSGTVGTSTHSTGSHIPNVDNSLVLAYFSLNTSSATFTESSGTERFDTNGIAMCSQTVTTAAPITVTGTSSVGGHGNALMVVLAGATSSYATVSMKDWSFSDVARTPVEIARDSAAQSSGIGTWTDVSTSVRSFETQGAARQYELDQMEAGTTSLLLKDPNRYFDPANGSSIYSPNVVPMRKMRGRTTYQGTVYDLFYTYIERWPPQNFVIGYQEIGITAVDGFDALALAGVSGPLAVGYSGAQIDALLDKALWPKDARAIDPGQYVMAAQTLSGAKALGAIQEIADSERGLFFVDQSGIATFHDSAHRGSFPRSTQSQVTFTDNHSATGIFYQGLAPSFDKDKIVNEWTVSPDSSVFAAAAQTQNEPSSVAQYWRRSNSRSTRLVSDSDALAQAGNLLTETAWPALRFESLTVLPTTVAAYTACLGLTISDRVTVIRGNNPGWDGDVITKDCFIEARRISALPATPWTFTFALSPVSAGNYRDTIVRDGPVSYWRMDEGEEGVPDADWGGDAWSSDPWGGPI